MHSISTLISLLSVAAVLLDGVAGHGMMLDPPSRSSLWRIGFDAPKNYNDMELFCGGKDVQWNEINKGRCGECGDEWSLSRPRPNDEGGIYYTGIKGQTYTRGQVVRLEIQLTATHQGYFEFRLCPKKSADELVTQECFDRHLLELVDGTTRFPVTIVNPDYLHPAVKLPDDVVCEHCVIQWYYRAGNSWGYCDDGSSGLGCGPQESFVNCADVEIKG